MKPLKIAIVGCGAITENFYIPALKALKKDSIFQVNALVDPCLDTLKTFKAHFPEAHCYTHIEVLDNQDLDAAIVASPVKYHAEQTIALLNQGLHVLCEKPMANSLEEAQAMLNASQKNSRLLAIGLFRRFFPAVQSIKALLKAETFGTVESFSFTEGGLFAWPIKSDSIFKKETNPGGILSDIGVHVLDLVSFWFKEGRIVSYQDDAMGGISTNCFIKLEFPQGLKGNVRLSWDSPVENKYIIHCEKGSLIWEPGKANELLLKPKDSPYALDATTLVNLATYDTQDQWVTAPNMGKSFTQQLINFGSAIRGDTVLHIPAEEGIKSIELIDSCYKNHTLLAQNWTNLANKEEKGRSSPYL
tara:strand:+ start:7873 stop:8952 length:1080 start_codon:yes stop_codon:yes gene_type:complete